MDNSEYVGKHAKKGGPWGNYTELSEGYHGKHEKADESAITKVEGLSDTERAKLPTSAEDHTKIAEETYDNLQQELDDIDSELEKNPDNAKLIEYARQTTKIMEDILDRLDGYAEAATRDKSQDVGAKVLGSPKMQYQNSRGEIYNSPEDALASEAR